MGNKMATYLFPGLGSQYKGMGSGLFKNYPQLVAAANEILGFSVQDLCVHDPQKQLSNFQFVQPALFVVNALTYLQNIESTGKIPDYVVGHSLGEYNALWAAGVFDFATAFINQQFNTDLEVEVLFSYQTITDITEYIMDVTKK
jgi:trans-AT polyketide synthase/acyltransferase/oxidoreductase domain-containing protein